MTDDTDRILQRVRAREAVIHCARQLFEFIDKPPISPTHKARRLHELLIALRRALKDV